MSRYINADEIVYSDVTDENRPAAGARITYKGQINRIPTADVAPVVHGHWIYLGGGLAKCSVCKWVVKDCYDQDNEDLFCRKCGAKMDGRITETDAALDCAQHTVSGLLDD